MSLIDVLMNGVHLGFAGFWVGSVIFVTVAISRSPARGRSTPLPSSPSPLG